MKTQTVTEGAKMDDKPMCEDCETEIVEGLGCDCGNYEPGFDKVAFFVEKQTGYQIERA